MSQDFSVTWERQKPGFLDKVDAEWMAEELPNDDIIIPQTTHPFVAEDIEEMKKPEKSWAELEQLR